MKPIEPTLLSRLRALPRPAWILFLGTFLNKFGTFVLPFLTLYLTQRGFSLNDAGLAISAYGVGGLMASVLGGHLADAIGRRKTIALSMFSVAAAMVLLSQSRSLPAIIAATWLAALTGELYRPASSALLADLVPPELRVTAYAAYRMAFNAGFAFGPATAGFLAARGYFWLFAGDAATSVLFGVIALVALPRGLPSRREEGGWRHDLKTVASDGRFVRLLSAAFLIALVFLQISSTFSLQVTGQGFPAATYGLILSLNGVLVVLCELPLTSVTRRFPARAVMAVGLPADRRRIFPERLRAFGAVVGGVRRHLHVGGNGVDARFGCLHRGLGAGAFARKIHGSVCAHVVGGLDRRPAIGPEAFRPFADGVVAGVRRAGGGGRLDYFSARAQRRRIRSNESWPGLRTDGI